MKSKFYIILLSFFFKSANAHQAIELKVNGSIANELQVNTRQCQTAENTQNQEAPALMMKGMWWRNPWLTADPPRLRQPDMSCRRIIAAHNLRTAQFRLAVG